MPEPPRRAVWVARGDDRYGEHHSLGIGVLSLKVTTKHSHGALFVLELAHHPTGGPARHFHYDQDEWFSVVEREYIAKVGPERFRLKAGHSLSAPRRVPHAWAHVGDQLGRIVITLAPAGQIEAHFRALNKANAMAPQAPALWPPYGMELLGRRWPWTACRHRAARPGRP